MFRRIAAAGLGGVAGLVLWYYLVNPLERYAATAGNSRAGTKVMKYLLTSAAISVFAGGALALFGGQFLRIVPTQEQVEKQSKPLSLRDQ